VSFLRSVVHVRAARESGADIEEVADPRIAHGQQFQITAPVTHAYIFGDLPSAELTQDLFPRRESL
jgi:hypothetical protein